MNNVICPFFHAEGKNADGTRRITCEGCTVRFPDLAARRGYVYRYCCSNWKRCTIAQMLLGYYETEKEGTDHGKL